jgi:hypothetical protein
VSPKEINLNTLNSFLVRCIGHASAVAIDAEFGLGVRHVETTIDGNVKISLDNDHIVMIDARHLVPHQAL